MDFNSKNTLSPGQPFRIAGENFYSWCDQITEGMDFKVPDSPVLHVRRMQSGDVPFICSLEKQIFSSPWTEEGFLYKLGNHQFNVSLVGLIDKEIVSYAVSFFILDELHVSNVAVQKNFRRKRIGETMLWISMQVGLEMGAGIVHLEVRKSNAAAIELYKKYQFELIGIRKGYYEHENEDALLMSRNLKLEKTHGLV